jgi:hypothetical protein
MLGSTSVFALVLAGGLLLVPNTASAGPFDDLCGTTITTDTVIDGVTDVVDGNCVINVVDRVNFSIIDSDIATINNGDLEIYGEGRAQPPKDPQLLISGTVLDIDGDLEIRFEEGNIQIVNGNDFTVSSSMTVEAEGGDIVIFDDNDIVVGNFILVTNAEGGDIVIQDNPLTIDANRIEIVASDKSNVSIKNNGFITRGEVEIDTEMGNVSVKENGFDIDKSQGVTIATQGGDISVKGNEFVLDHQTGQNVDVEAGGGGKVTFKDNTGVMNGNLVISTIDAGDAGDVTVFDNDIDIGIGVNPGSVNITSEGGDIAVRGNDFQPADGGTNVDAMGGDCVVDSNAPVLTCI